MGQYLWHYFHVANDFQSYFHPLNGVYADWLSHANTYRLLMKGMMCSETDVTVYDQEIAIEKLQLDSKKKGR